MSESASSVAVSPPSGQAFVREVDGRVTRLELDADDKAYVTIAAGPVHYRCPAEGVLEMLARQYFGCKVTARLHLAAGELPQLQWLKLEGS